MYVSLELLGSVVGDGKCIREDLFPRFGGVDFHNHLVILLVCAHRVRFEIGKLARLFHQIERAMCEIFTPYPWITFSKVSSSRRMVMIAPLATSFTTNLSVLAIEYDRHVLFKHDRCILFFFWRMKLLPKKKKKKREREIGLCYFLHTHTQIFYIWVTIPSHSHPQATNDGILSQSIHAGVYLVVIHSLWQHRHLFLHSMGHRSRFGSCLKIQILYVSMINSSIFFEWTFMLCVSIPRLVA